LIIILNFFGKKYNTNVDFCLEIKKIIMSLKSNLLIFFKLFNNRPNHLVDFLLKNNALNDDFIKKINNSDKIKNIDEIKEYQLNFNSIDEMNNFYKSVVDDLDSIRKNKSKEEIINELNEKIKKSIEMENYEEAARIRDYMIKNNFKKI
jgi:cysteinyl-tRNA synthetase